MRSQGELERCGILEKVNTYLRTIRTCTSTLVHQTKFSTRASRSMSLKVVVVVFVVVVVVVVVIVVLLVTH